MLTILCPRTDGGVTNYPPNPDVLQTMMGQGLGWSATQIQQETAKLVQDTRIPWPVLLATAWVTALANGSLTESQALELFRQRFLLIPGVTGAVVVDDNTLPAFMTTDRYFRDAAEWNGVACVCNMGKARLIHMGRIRKVRDGELVKLDVPYMKALETGDVNEQNRIAGLKQALRDIPQTFSLAGYSTPEALKAAWPPELPR